MGDLKHSILSEGEYLRCDSACRLASRMELTSGLVDCPLMYTMNLWLVMDVSHLISPVPLHLGQLISPEPLHLLHSELVAESSAAEITPLPSQRVHAMVSSPSQCGHVFMGHLPFLQPTDLAGSYEHLAFSWRL